MLIAVVSALVWSFLWTLVTSSRNELWPDLIALPFHGTLMTSWFILPLGGILGACLPRLSALHSVCGSTLIGGGVGGAIGFLCAILTSKFVWQLEFKNYASMIPFCAFVVGFWTWLLVRK